MGEAVEQILALDAEKRRELIGIVWDSLVDEGAELPLTDEQRAVLQQRLADHESDPDTAISWNDAKRQLRGH